MGVGAHRCHERRIPRRGGYVLGEASDGLDDHDLSRPRNFGGGRSLEEGVTVSEEAAAFANPHYSNVGLLPGEVLSVRELLMVTMVSSDVAAYVLGEALDDGSVDDIVERMNGEAEALGLEDTSFRTRSASTPAASTPAPGIWWR